jgi:hypothetical protein
MNKIQSRLSRRDFLKLTGLAGASIAGGHLLYSYSPWMDYDEQVSRTRRMFDQAATVPAQMKEIVRYATLAANSHNTQPWKFIVKENALEIHPDYMRHLPVVDPENRELWISLGCALENLLIAVRAAGYAPEVIYPDRTDFIRVELTADKPQSDALFESIPMRQNTRSEYDGKPVSTADLSPLQNLALEPDVILRFAESPSSMETILDYVNQGNLTQYADKAFVAELIHWLRFNKREILTSLDGLYTLCSGNPEVPHWLGELFVSGTNPQQQADADSKKLRSSSGAVVIASEVEGKTAWVRTGQVYERLALQMTSLNIKSALLNQPVEVANLRGQFQSAIGLGSAQPQLIVRFGYADAMPHSVRRPVEQVLL